MQLFLETNNGIIRSYGKMITPRAEEGCCNEATQSAPSSYSQSQQAQNISNNSGVKKGQGKK